MARKFALVFAMIGFTGCATTHPGSIAQSSDKALVISVERNSEISDRNYLFYEYTIENTTSEWKQTQLVDVDFDGEDSEVLAGDKLSAWLEGAELKLKASQYNQSLLLGSMAVVGGVTALTSGNSSGQKTGSAMLAGSALVAAGSSLSRQQGEANSGLKFEGRTVNVPKTHAFVPSQVAPNSYIRRWIVLRASVPDPAKKAIRARGQPFFQAPLISKFTIDGKPVEYTATVQTTRR